MKLKDQQAGRANRKMAKKSVLETEESAVTIENSVISDYVRLCLLEGIKPGDAFREMKRKLQAVKLNQSIT